MSKTMILVQATWNENQTFKMIPIDESCPYVECIYDPDNDVFVAISKVKRVSLQMLPKLDEYGQPITGAKGTRQERHKVEVFQEYYIEKQDGMLELVKLFAVNSDKFDYQSFMKKK